VGRLRPRPRRAEFRQSADLHLRVCARRVGVGEDERAAGGCAWGGGGGGGWKWEWEWEWE